MQQPYLDIPEHVASLSATVEARMGGCSEAAVTYALQQSYRVDGASSLATSGTQTFLAKSANNLADSNIDGSSPCKNMDQSIQAPHLPPPQEKDTLFMLQRQTRDTSLQISLESNYDQIREGFSVQRMCISEIFYCHDSDTVERLFERLSIRESISVPLPLLCELCALAATSGQYVRGLIAPDLLDYWYG